MQGFRSSNLLTSTQRNWERAQKPDTLEPIEPLKQGTSMSSLARIVAAKHLGDHRLLLTFSDGLVREFDFDGVLEGAVFEILRDVSVSSLVAVDEVAGTIGWLSGVDFDPDVLHGDFEAVNGS